MMEHLGRQRIDPRLYYDVVLLLLLVRSGDVETNPGPTGRRSVAQGPSTDEQVFTLNTQVNIYLMLGSASICFLSRLEIFKQNVKT